MASQRLGRPRPAPDQGVAPTRPSLRGAAGGRRPLACIGQAARWPAASSPGPLDASQQQHRGPDASKASSSQRSSLQSRSERLAKGLAVVPLDGVQVHKASVGSTADLLHQEFQVEPWAGSQGSEQRPSGGLGAAGQHSERQDSSSGTSTSGQGHQHQGGRLRSGQPGPQQRGQQRGPRSQQQRRDRPLDDRELTAAIARSPNLGELHALQQAHHARFNRWHVACMINRLAKVPGTSSPGAAPTVRRMLAFLDEAFVRSLPEFSAREVCNAVWAWARLAHVPSEATWQATLEAVCRQAPVRPAQAVPGQAAAAAAAAAGQSRRQHLAHEAGLLLTSAAPQAITNLAWGLCQAGCRDARAWERVAAATRLHLSALEPVDVSLLAWSFATAGVHAQGLVGELAQHATAGMDEFKPQDLCNLLWAAASAGDHGSPLFAAAAPAVLATLPGFTAQGLANVLWAYATAGQLQPCHELALTLAREAARRLHQFEPQHVAMAAWAAGRTLRGARREAAQSVADALQELAQPSHYAAVAVAASAASGGDAALASAVPQHGQRLGSTHNSSSNAAADAEADEALQALADGFTLGGDSLAPAGLCGPVLLTRQQQRHTELAQVLQPLLSQAAQEASSRLGAFKTKELALLLWSLAAAGLTEEPLLGQAAGEVATRLRGGGYNPHDLGSVLWAYATAGQHHGPLFDAAAQLCQRHARALVASPQALANVMWALGASGHRDLALLRTAAAHLASLSSSSSSEGGAEASGRGLNASQAAAVLMSLATLRLSGSGATDSDGQVAAAAGPSLSEEEARAAELAACAGTARFVGCLLSQAQGPLQEAAARPAAQAVPVQALARCCWAMAVLGHDDPAFFAAAFAEAEKAAQRGPLPMRECSQLLQAAVWLQHHRRQAQQQGAPAAPLLLLKHVRRCWRDASQLQEASVSNFQRSVFAELQGMGLQPQMERLTPDGLFSVDILLHLRGVRVAVEVDGPSHYARNHTHSLLGHTQLRDSLLRASGMRVLRVPWFEWEQVASETKSAQAYLRQKLEQTVPANAAAFRQQRQQQRQQRQQRQASPAPRRQGASRREVLSE